MPASVLLSAASAALGIASLNLCTDEYLLLLAKPDEVVSVSHLARDPLESPLWRAGRRHPGNNGSLESVLARRPTHVLAMGGGGRMRGPIAARLGIAVIDLPPPQSVADVAGNLRSIARLLGRPESARPWLRRLGNLRRNRPARSREAVWVSAGGRSLDPAGPGGEWLGLAGIGLRAFPGAQVDLPSLLARPPQLLIRSDYRNGQASRGNAWLRHPLLSRWNKRTIITDGRRWTCMGPLLIDEIERLRKAAG